MTSVLPCSFGAEAVRVFYNADFYNQVDTNGWTNQNSTRLQILGKLCPRYQVKINFAWGASDWTKDCLCEVTTYFVCLDHILYVNFKLTDIS